MIAASRAKAPTIEKRTVPRGRLPNADYRSREYLTEREVDRLMKVAVDNRHGHRDATMILLAFRHGLRASELCSLRWEQVDLTHGRLHIQRLKNGMPSVHPLTGTELRALRRLQREQAPGRYVFVSERGARSARPLEARLPTMSHWKEAPQDGGLMSYGTNRMDSFRRVATLSAKFLMA